MRKIKIAASNLLLVMMCFVFAACPPDPDPVINTKKDLVGYKFTYVEYDGTLTDYGGYVDEFRTELYFMTERTGYLYWLYKDWDTDLGTTTKVTVRPFDYEVNGLAIYAYFEDGATEYYTYSNKEIIDNSDCYYNRSNISYSDRKKLEEAIEASRPKTGNCGKDLSYSYDKETYTLTISGTGDMYDYTSGKQPWSEYVYQCQAVEVESGVTSIGKYAFYDMIQLEEVDLPNTVKRIGDYAFSKSGVTSIYLPSCLENIGAEAFAGCAKLKYVSLTAGNIVSIGEMAFASCEKLRLGDLDFGTKLRNVDRGAFMDVSVGEISFGEGVTSIGSMAFLGGIDNEELVLPNSLKTIGGTAFQGYMESITLGSGIKELGSNTFITSRGGKLYINRGTPPTVEDNIIVDDYWWNSNESKWTLYVPKGCKSSYSSKSPWNKFKYIYEDSSLEEGGNSGSDEISDAIACVDLGLSVKWATCNVGASNPEDYGDYYAWGETTTKSDYSLETYKWCKGTYNTMTKYCTNSDYGTVDNRTTLTSSDDVASVKWGSKWRMPTKEEMKELAEDCTWTWTTQNGVNGMKVTGPNGNSIFLPAASYSHGTGPGRGGFYWSATLYENYSYVAYRLGFNSGGSDRSYWGHRYYGFTVRPVTE